ncbi:MAG TPA: AAA family ATPase [Streptosporangiaceae bacterium]|nr:AAA family ATPase [Streptosporangiaceae bacterium]
MLEMHTHYQLNREPFTKNLTLDMLHHHHGHDEAAARITWCISQGAIGVITGEAGAGKTAAARAAIGGIDRTRHHVIYIANPTLGARGLWAAVVAATGGKPAIYTAALATQAEHALAAEAEERGRRPILILDEAHLTTPGQLEALRMLTNSELDSASPCTVILLGQPTLRRMIKHGQLASLDQRISVKYHLAGMTETETPAYIRHHLQICGRGTPLFTDDAVTLIHQVSRGYPRTINNICRQALLAGWASRKTLIDDTTTRTAIAEVITPDELTPSS